MSKRLVDIVTETLGVEEGLINHQTLSMISSLSSYYDALIKSLGIRGSNFRFNPGEGAYSVKQLGSLNIYVGIYFYLHIRSLDGHAVVAPQDYRKYTRDILKVTDGVFWHELFHLFYTDMHFGQTVMEKLRDMGLAGLFHYFKTLFNIIEDQYIEIEGVFQHPYSYDSVRYLNYVAAQSYRNLNLEQHTWDVTKFDDLIHFIYYKLRAPSIKVQEHPLFTQHRDFIEHSIQLILQTFIPTLRVERTLAFTIELLKMFALDYEPDLDIVEAGGDADEQLEGAKDMVEAQTYQASEVRQESKMEINTGTVAVDNSAMLRPGDQFLDRTITPEEAHAISKQSERPSTLENQLAPTSDVYIDQLVRKMAADVPYKTHPSHTESGDHLITRDGKSRLPYYAEIASKLLHKYSKQISMTAQAFDEIKEMARAKTRNDLYSGDKLNLRSLYDPAMVGKYQSDIAEVEVNNLSVSLMVDMSGSMANAKSEFARDAAFMIAKALEYSGVPFELSYYTTAEINNRHHSYVGIVKSFDEPVTKDMLSRIAMMNLRDMRKDGIFFTEVGNANVDEIAIMQAVDRFADRDEQTKLMIVLSDGATVGSATLLKQVVESLPDYGIQSFGVGLYSREVSKIYQDHLLIDEEDQLKLLPKTLMDVVMRNVSKLL
jgi:hypothetical protein